MEDSDVRPPSIEDFPANYTKGRLFIDFVTICILLGDIAQCHRRKSFTASQRYAFENAVYRWIKELPPEHRLFQLGPKRSLSPYNFEARQLHVPYFVILVILCRAPSPGSTPSAASLVASSFIASIYEDFIARDELRHLGPVFTFYALAAGLSQLSGYRYPSLAAAAEHNYETIQLSLQILAKRWESAIGASKALREAREAVARLPPLRTPPAHVPADCPSFFSDFGPDLCNMWHLLEPGIGMMEQSRDQGTTMSLVTPLSSRVQMDALQALGTEGFEGPGTSQNVFEQFQPDSPSLFPPFIDGNIGHQSQDLMWDTSDLIGLWLLDDLEKQAL